MHTGDQVNEDDFDLWIDHMHERFEVDVLIVNCWARRNLPRFVQGIKPRLVITGHENELYHDVHHREPYSRTYQYLKEEPTPALVMTWGERYHYEKSQSL